MSLLTSTIARHALEQGIANLEKDGTVGLVIVAEKDGDVQDINLPPGAEMMLNHGAAKDILFQGLREAVKKVGATTIAICTESWISVSTPSGIALGTEMLQKLYNLNGHEWMVDNGYTTRFEAITVVVQNAEYASTSMTPFRRVGGGFEYLPPIGEFEGPQDDFDGRMKMFGKEPDPSVWHCGK